MSHISEVSVSNVALSRLGERRIEDMNDGSKAAGLCKANFPFARRKTLRRYRWNFALRTIELAQTNAPMAEWAYAFTLPGDCVRVCDLLQAEELPPSGIINPGGVTASSLPAKTWRLEWFKVEGQAVLTDAPRIFLKYVSDVDTLPYWDDLAIDVLALELATRIAIPLTGDDQKRADAIQELEQLVLAEARYIDSVEDGSGENYDLNRRIKEGLLRRARFHPIT